MVRGTIFSFVVAAFFFLAYIISMHIVYALLSIFMALFGAILLLLEMKDKSDRNKSIVEYDDDEDENYYEETKLIASVAAVA